MYRKTMLPMILLCMAGTAGAKTPINQTHPLTADGRVEISNVTGEVKVTGWDRNEVSITGSLGEGAKPLQVQSSKNKISVKVEAEHASGLFNWGDDSHMKPTTLILQVPRGVHLDIDVVSADARVDGLTGGKIGIDSVSGQVHVHADSPSVEIDSVSGDVEMAGVVQNIDIDTVSGDIHVPMVRHEGKLESVSGDIEVRGGPFENMDASTVSGDLFINGGPSTSGRMHVETMSGDVGVQLPMNVSAHIEASTFSGDIDSNLGNVNQRKHGPGSELNATVGDGKGNISLESFSGDIRIQRSGGDTKSE